MCPPVILLTGFEPFGGAPANPSIEVARRAAEMFGAGGDAAVAVELPCVFALVPAALDAALERYRPTLVICTGLAAGRAEISLERVAINVIDARIPDNAGKSPIDVPVDPVGPAAYFSTLPLKRCLRALRAAGVPAAVSQSAGTFACNQAFYLLMRALAAAEGAAGEADAGNGGGGRGMVRGGFVHVPPTGAGGLGVEEAATALVIVAGEALDATPDIQLAAGSIA